MIKGTTQGYSFTIPFDASEVKSVIVSFGQNDIETLCKKTEDCIIEGHLVTVRLSQQDTLAFEEGCYLQAQLRILKTDGEAVSTKTMVLDDVYKSLNDEVMV